MIKTIISPSLSIFLLMSYLPGLSGLPISLLSLKLANGGSERRLADVLRTEDALPSPPRRRTTARRRRRVFREKKFKARLAEKPTRSYVGRVILGTLNEDWRNDMRAVRPRPVFTGVALAIAAVTTFSMVDTSLAKTKNHHETSTAHPQPYLLPYYVRPSYMQPWYVQPSDVRSGADRQLQGRF
jgi:hypothetical protein